MVRDIFSIIPRSFRVEASFCIGRYIIGWRKSETTGEMLREKVVVGEFIWANNGILAGDYTGLDTTETKNNLELNKEAEDRNLRRIAEVTDLLEIWQRSQNLCATPKECRAQNKQMTAVGFISDSDEIIKASWSNFQHDGAAAFKLFDRSPLQPASSAKDLPGGRTEVLNVRPNKWNDRYPAERD